MGVRLLILRLCFVVGLFIIPFLSCKARESQEFTTSTYLSNYIGAGGFGLSLRNDDNSFVIYYSESYDTSVKLYITIKDEDAIIIKDIKLNKYDVCLYDNLSNRELSLDNSSLIKKWNIDYDVDFNRCKAKWKELIEDAKGGDLKFKVTVSKLDDKNEKTYEFRVSAANLGLLVGLIEKVYQVYTE
ncbi:hypothetical protein bcCo53_001190 (plasmid) [Borrelia coriaceae]|uniref:Uncharacterized protein n=1 Tax=Borrelia coriaceae ATCC 43381 TaxID=1408429 RepID=W5T1G8_9SPIR|nr:hypothetical protein [Borrelia coriaceae]AHH11101.1 hypothetical protein BCO_0000805 [Borrelia coriaceae ATCC 43381]UPA17021.1 hypothetical protein bcCo53_001190 [Borrelia coriaceae]